MAAGDIPKYTFKLYAVPLASYANPTQALSTNPILTEVVENIQSYTLNTSTTFLDPTMQYVWQVKAEVLGKPTLYANNGLSAPCLFKLVNPNEQAIGDLSINLTAEATGTTMGKATWTVSNSSTLNPNNAFDGFIISYRKQGDPNTWYEQDLNLMTYSLQQLEENTTYEVKVKGYIASTYSAWTDIKTFTTGTVTPQECGPGNNIQLPSQFVPLEPSNAYPSVQIKQGEFDVTALQISPVQGGQPGHYQGSGFVYIPFLHFPVPVTFDDLQVDENYISHSGDVIVPSRGIDAWLQEQYLDEVDPATIINIPGTWADTAWINDTTGLITNNLSNSIQINTAANDPLPTIVHDQNNNEIQFWPDGTIVVTTYGLNPSSDHLAITADKQVHFIDSPNQTYPTDAKEYAHLSENYECIVEGNINYFVANKSALNNTADAIKAKVKIANFARSNLSFRLDGSTDTITYTYTPSDSSCTLQIPGNTGNHSLYAYYNNDKVGKLNVKVFTEVTKNVTIVPLVNFSLTKTEIETAVNNIYRGAHVKVNVTIAPQYTYTAVTTFDNPETDVLSMYTPQMRALRDTYLASHQIADESYVMFVIPSFVDQNLDGYMVRGRSVGFIASNAITNISNFSRTFSHELGHGIGGLKHVWGEQPNLKGQTNNLMDYDANQGTKLIASQWKDLHDAPLVISFLDGEEDGSSAIVGSKGKIPAHWFSQDYKIAFLTPGKTIAKFSNKIKSASFTLGLNDFPDNPYIAAGLLKSFSYQAGPGTATKYYTAKVVNNQFLGYFDGNDKFKAFESSAQNDYFILPTLYIQGVQIYKVTNSNYTFQDSSSTTQPLFQVSLQNNQNNILAGTYNSIGAHTYGESLFEVNSDTYLSTDALSIFSEYNPYSDITTKFLPSYLLFEKIVELRSSYPDIYDQMSIFDFADWNHPFTVGSGMLMDAFLNLTPEGIVQSFFGDNYSPLQEGSMGYFDYLYFNNNYSALEPADQIREFLKEFDKVIKYKRQQVQSEINAIKTACSSSDELLPVSINTTTKVMSVIKAMSVLECSEICPLIRCKLIDVLLNPGAENLWMTTDDLEAIIDKLVWTTPESQYNMFLYDMTHTPSQFVNKLIIEILVDAVDDRTLLIGNNYNTKIMNWFIKSYNIYKKAYLSNITYSKNNIEDYKKRIISYDYTGFTKRLFKQVIANSMDVFAQSFGWPSIISPVSQMVLDSDPMSSVSIDMNNFKVNFKNETVLGFYTTSTSPTISLDPLEPVILTSKDNLIDIYSDNSGLFIPAFVLYFVERKADAKTTAEAIQTAVDIASLALPGGQLKVLTYMDRISSLASMAGNITASDYPKVTQLLNITSSVLGVTSLLDAGSFKNLGSQSPAQYMDFASNSSILKSTSHIQDVKNLTNKIINQDAAIVDAISNPTAKNLLLEILETESGIAKSSNTLDVVTEINKAIAKIKGLNPNWLQIPFYNKLSKYSDRWIGNEFWSKVGGTKIAHIDANNHLILDHVDEITALSTDAKFIDDIDISATEDVLIFKNSDGSFKCLSSGNCFAKNTKIKTMNGYKTIQDIKKDDKVLSFDEKNNVMEYQSVSNVFKRSVNKLQRLIIGSDTIFTTSEHPFYVKTKGWVKAGMLSVGMLIQTSSSVAEVIENVEKDTLAEVYNFTVENTHTYVVGKNELIVHNTCKKLASVVEQMGDDADEFLNYLGTISSASRRTEIIDAAEIIQTAISGTTKFARDPQTLNKLADMAKSGSSWRNKRNSFWKSDLNDIIKTNNNVACLTCGTSGLIGRSRMDILLEDVDYIVANFNVTSGSNMEGLYTWLRGKAMNGGTPTSGQLDEVHQTISTIKREGLTDASIDAIGKTMANSTKKFDLKLVNGKYIELKNKNYTSGSLDVDDVDQVINGYFKEIDDINNFTWELKYAKNSALGTVLEVENIMKTKWKNALINRKTEIWNSMKPNVRISLGMMNPSDLTDAKIEDIINIFVKVK